MIGRCALCGRYGCMERHHIFGGPNRSKSEKYGLVALLCHNCHNEPPNGVHHNDENMLLLHQIGQRKWMKETGGSIKDFIAEFGKNYI